MANLLFKKGSYELFKEKVLTGNAAVEGALYLTEDEGALYLGQNGGTVKRISGYVQVYSDLTAFVEDGPKPPYSTDVVYFIAAENALVRFDDVANKWVQLNTTANKLIEELAKRDELITANAGAIDAINAALETNTENIGKNAEAIATLRTDLTEDIEDLDERLGVAEESLNTKAAQADLEELSGRVDAHDTALESINGALDTKASAEDLTKLTERVSTNETNIGTLQTDLGNLTTDVGGKATQADLEELSGRVDTHDTTLEEYNTRIGDNETAIGTLQTDLGALTTEVGKKASQTALDNLATEVGKKAAQTDFEELEGRVDTAEQAIINLTDNKVEKDANARLITLAEAEKLANIAEEATKVIVDSELSETSTNPVENQAIAKELSSIDNELDAINRNLEGIHTNYATKEELSTAEEGLQGQIDDLSEALGLSDGTGSSSIASRLNALESDNTANKNAITEHGGKIETLEGGVADLNAAISGEDGLNERLTTAESEIDDLQSDLEDLTEKVNGVDGRLVTAEGEIDSLQAKDVELAGKVEALEAIDFATKTDVSDAEGRLNTTINDRILAANAMTYKDKVNSETDLPTNNVTVGDTYVVATAFGDYQVGDLLIAKGTEVNGIIDPDTLDWDHIPTGYTDAHDSKLVVEDNTIKLLDFSGNVLGAAVIKSVSNNIIVSTENGNEITMALEWDTF